jgi:hypothetical protein
MGDGILDGDSVEAEDAAIVCLEEMVGLDPTLVELVRDLPLGWAAWREAPHRPWQRAEQALPDDD